MPFVEQEEHYEDQILDGKKVQSKLKFKGYKKNNVNLSY